MLVALQLTVSAKAKFWIGIIINFIYIEFIFINFNFLAQIESEPNNNGIYQVRYYSYNHKTKWVLGRGPGWYGTCSRDAVLVAGFTLTKHNELTKTTIKHIDYVLHQENVNNIH